jgi:hypothetical protein
VPQQLQVGLIEEFPVGLTCSSSSRDAAAATAAAAGGGGCDAAAAAGGCVGVSGGGGSGGCVVSVRHRADGGTVSTVVATYAEAAAAAVRVMDALGREVAICPGGVQLPLLLQMCRCTSSSSSTAAQLCVELLVLLAGAGMQQWELDTLAGKLTVKIASEAAAVPGPAHSGPGGGLVMGPGSGLVSVPGSDLVMGAGSDPLHSRPGSGLIIGPSSDSARGPGRPGNAVLVWQSRLQNILGKPLVRQQLLEHRDKLQHLQKLLSL